MRGRLRGSLWNLDRGKGGEGDKKTDLHYLFVNEKKKAFLLQLLLQLQERVRGGRRKGRFYIFYCLSISFLADDSCAPVGGWIEREVFGFGFFWI